MSTERGGHSVLLDRALLATLDCHLQAGHPALRSSDTQETLGRTRETNLGKIDLEPGGTKDEGQEPHWYPLGYEHH